MREDLPGPMRRRGPRPLLLHLTLAMLRSNVSLATSLHSNPGWPSSSAEAIRRALQSHDGAGAFPEAVLRETLERDAALIEGIAAYRRHPWRREVDDPPVIWREGGSRLLDYGGPAGAAEGGDGPTLLVVPSLVNRSYILDLMPGAGMLRWLAGQGVRPVLLDWGWPDAERGFTLTDYIAGRLERAMAWLGTALGPVVLAGYCMGGLLAVAAAQRRPELVRGLALLATPWDFHAPDPERARAAADCLPLLEPAMEVLGYLPVDLLQALFALLDPWGVAGKYRAFARLDPDGARARMFVALEDWLNDGVPLAAPVARACLSEWYGANAAMRGTWRVAGAVVDPRAIDCPAFVAIPSRDRIVPPESARPLGALIPGATVHTPAAGHVGMVAGAAAQAALWQPLAAWLRLHARVSDP